MTIISLFFKNWWYQKTRRFYWLWRLSQAKIGRNVRIVFPLCVEGSGNIFLADNCVIRRGGSLKCSAESKISLGACCTIEENVMLCTGKGANLLVGENCKILRQTTLWINNDWSIGPGSTIASYCAIGAREPGVAGKFTVGEGCNIGDNSLFDLSDDLIIGDGVAVGPCSIIYTHDHNYEHEGSVAWKGEVLRNKVVIEDGAWVGARVTILPGVTIGKRSVIAAGAVVTHNVPPGSLVGGIPAKPLKAL